MGSNEKAETGAELLEVQVQELLGFIRDRVAGLGVDDQRVVYEKFGPEVHSMTGRMEAMVAEIGSGGNREGLMSQSWLEDNFGSGPVALGRLVDHLDGKTS